MSFGAFIGGLTQGYQVGQNLQDQKQRREIEAIKLKQLQDEAKLTEDESGLNAEAAKRLGASGAPQDAIPGMAPDGSVTVQATEAPAASAGVQPAVGLPAGVPGQGAMRPSAMEAGGATQQPGAEQAAGGLTAKLPEMVVRPKPDPAKRTSDFFKARVDVAMEKGDHRLIKRATEDYANHLVKQSQVLDTEYKERTRAADEALRTGKTQAEVKQLAMDAQRNQITAMGTVLWLYENGFTDKAIAASRHAGIGGEGWELKEFRPGKDGVIEVVGADGKVAMTFTPEQARTVRAQSGISTPKSQNVILAEGAEMRTPDGKLVAENRKDARPTPDQTLQRQNQLDRNLGADYGTTDPMGRLMISPEKRSEYESIRSAAHQYVRDGMDAVAALEKAKSEYKAKAGGGKPAPAAGAAPAPAVADARKKLGF
jgi:hypothetical protein